MQCPQCHYRRSANAVGLDSTCPRCGIIYAKFDPAVKARRESLRKIGEQRIYRESLADSVRVNAAEAARARKGRGDWVEKLLRGLVISSIAITFGIFITSIMAGVLGLALLPDNKVINIFIVGGR